MKNKHITVLLLLILHSIGIFAVDMPARPAPPRLVNDLAGLLDTRSANELEEQLALFARETSTQIAIVTLNDLMGYDAGDYAFRLAESWGVGQQGRDNGILILIKPRINNERGQAYIATGYGLEGVVPDAVARRIVDNEMIPHFRNDDYYAGILSGVSILMDLTRGEYTADTYVNRTGSREEAAGAIFALILFIVIFVFATKAQKSKQASIGHDIPFWILMSMMGSGSRRHSGQWGNFSSGRGSFGGGSSGGFGGFGGGRFGGGGAGGSW